MFSFNKGFKVKVLELARVDSGARASRSHQVLKRNLAHGSRFGTRQEGEEEFQQKIFVKTCIVFVSVKIYFYIKCKG